VVVIAKHEPLLRQLGLATLAQVRQFNGGELVKNHRGRRDIRRIRAGAADGREVILYLKRNLHPYRKDGFMSLCRRGRIWSLSRQEWENSQSLARAGLSVAGLVAYGEECGSLWERFSYLLTEAAPGTQTLDQFLASCRDQARRRGVLDALAGAVRRMHEKGLASPDLYSRHWFVDETRHPPALCLIDMARLDHGRRLTPGRRARDLAVLNASTPLRIASPRERLRFLKIYAGRIDRSLVSLIERRMRHLLLRKKFRGFAAP
jgi:hypothetical protein